jgi:MFS family permease
MTAPGAPPSTCPSIDPRAQHAPIAIYKFIHYNSVVSAREPQPASPRRNLYVFGATSFLNDTASEMAYWILPAFLLTIGAGPATLGLIEGIAESVASIAKLFSGYLTDRTARRKPIVVAGYAVANAVKPLLALVTSWWQVLLIRFSDRLFKGVRGTARDVMLAESVERRRIGGAFGLLQSMDTAGAIAGPLAALWLVAHYGFRGVFAAAAVPGFLAIMVALFGIQETGKRGRIEPAETGPRRDTLEAESKPPESVKDFLRPHIPATFYYVLAAVTLFSLANSSDMFLVLRAQDAGMKSSHAPLFGLVFNVTYTGFSWPMGRLSDRVSRRLIAAIGYAIFAAVYFVFAAAPSLLALWIAIAAYGVYNAMASPVLRALVVDTATPETRGRALGIFYFVTSVATLLASVLTGELWKHYGARLPFALSAILALIAGVMLLFSRRAR